jgi:hypothetical protein
MATSLQIPDYLRDVKVYKHHWVGNKYSRDKAASEAEKANAEDAIVKTKAYQFNLERCATLGPEYFPILRHTRWEGRLWTTVTHRQLTNLINHGNCWVYEILLPDLKRKVYFDVDKTSASLEEILAPVYQHFPHARCQVSGSEKDDGTKSYHITLSNYYADTLAAMLPVKLFTMKYQGLGYDDSVYTKNRNMKCINQSKAVNTKIGEKVRIQQYVSGDAVLTKHLILHDFDKDAVDINTMAFPFVEEAKAVVPVRKTKSGKIRKPSAQEIKSAMDICTIPQQDLPVPESFINREGNESQFNLEEAWPIDKLRLVPNPPAGSRGELHHMITLKLLTWAKHAGVSWEQFWDWCKQKSDDPEREAEHKANWDGCDHCYINPKFIHGVLLRFYPRILENRVHIRMRKHFTVEPHKLTPNKFMDESDIDMSKRFSVLAQAMGYGKTETVIRKLHWKDILKLIGNRKYMRVLWVTDRITLSANTRRRLAKAEFKVTNYKDLSKPEKMRGELNSRDFVICSIQSLHYLEKPFDIVVVDECESVLNSFSGDAKTHRNLFQTWSIWKEMIIKAKKCIFMDAFITKTTMNFLNNIATGDQIEVIDSEIKPTPRTFVECKNYASWVDQLTTHIRSGKKCYVFLPKKKGAEGVAALTEYLCEKFSWEEGKQILSYFAEKDEEKQALANVEEVWGAPELRCVVTNSCISVGVNYDADEPKEEGKQDTRFDKIFCMYAPNISVRDLIQGLYRIRHPVDDQMILFRTKKCNPDRANKRYTFPVCPIFKQLRSDLEIEEAANGEVGEYENLYLFAEKAGISFSTLEPHHIAKRNAKYIKNQLRDADVLFHWANIENTCDCCALEYEKMIAGNAANLDIRLRYEKWRFKKMFKEESYTEEEGTLATIFDTAPALPLAVKRLLRDEEHIINRFFADNGIGIGDAIPRKVRTNLKPADVDKYFKFHNKPNDMRSSLYSRMLKAFFGMPVYEPQKEEGVILRDSTGHYIYETNEKYQARAKWCKNNIFRADKEEDEEEDWEL